MRAPRAWATALLALAALAAPAARAEAPRALWERRVTRVPAQPPVLSGDTLWIVGTDRRLQGLDAASGERFWRRTLPAPPMTPPVPAGGIVAIAIEANAPRLHAARKRTGKMAWQVPIPGPVAAIGAGPHGIHALAGTGELQCLRTTDGGKAWEADLARPPAGLLFDGATARLYVLGRRDSLWCLDEETGRTLWSAALEGEFASPPARVGESLICAGYDGTITVLRAGDGGIVGTRHAVGPQTRAPAPGEDGSFLTVATGGEIAVWSASTGDPVWSLETRDTNAAGAVRWDGVWVVPSYVGRVHAYAGTPGRRGPDWSMTFRHPLRFPPAIDRRRIAFLDMEGHVTVYEAPGGRP